MKQKRKRVTLNTGNDIHHDNTSLTAGLLLQAIIREGVVKSGLNSSSVEE